MNPLLRRHCITVLRIFMSSMKALSVISISMNFGSILYFSTRDENTCGTFIEKMSMRETFIETGTGVIPLSIQARMVLQTFSQMYMSTFAIMPFFSRTGMNSPGETRPRNLFFQRTRASAPTILLSFIEHLGCRKKVNSSSSSPRLISGII